MAVKQKSTPEILTLHRQRYPLMAPEDYGKLLYQNEFGPEHMISSPEDVQEYLISEWNEMLRTDHSVPIKRSFAGKHETQMIQKNIEEIGNRLYRFHLTDDYDISLAAPLLARLFFRTAQLCRGTEEGLREKLALLQKQDSPAMNAWLEEYIREGCPALRHSDTFRQTYAPHYRILWDEYAVYFPIFYLVERYLRRSEPVILAIDGPCGSGKSSLAALLADLFPSRILHMDDYYLPPQLRSPGWETTPCGNMDLQRFLRDALLPAARGESITCQPYSCREGRLLETQMLPASPLTIVEGSYSHHPLLAPHYDLKIYLYCHHREQQQRIRRREGIHMDAYLQRWIPLEESYFRTFHIAKQSDLAFDNTPYFE